MLSGLCNVLGGVLWLILSWSVLTIVLSPGTAESESWKLPLAEQFLVPAIGFLYLGAILKVERHAAPAAEVQHPAGVSQLSRR